MTSHAFVIQCVTRTLSDWLVLPMPMRDVLKFASIRYGAQSVTTAGVLLRLQWHADKLGSPDLVRQITKKNNLT